MDNTELVEKITNTMQVLFSIGVIDFDKIETLSNETPLRCACPVALEHSEKAKANKEISENLRNALNSQQQQINLLTLLVADLSELVLSSKV